MLHLSLKSFRRVLPEKTMIEADRREEEMEEQHTGLTTSSFRGLDLRACETRAGAAEHAQRLVKHGLGLPLSDDADTMRCTGLRQGYRPPDRVRAFHDSSGRWSPQWQAFPQTLHADPPRPTPSPRRLTQPLLTHPGQRQEASWQPTSLVRIARVAAVNADYPATTGDAFVSRADRRQSDDPAKVGTSSSSRLSEEGVATSRFGDNASDAGLVHGSWRRSTHRFHLIDPSCHPRWSSNPSLEPLLTGRARWAGGLLHNADRSSVEQVAGEGDPEGALLGWPSQSPNEQSYRHQHPSVPSPTMTKAKRMRGHRGIASIAEFPETIQAGLDTGYQPGAPSWAAASARGRKRYREADSPPSASAQLQRQAPDDALDMGSVGERSGGKGRQTQQGGVLASPEMGGDRWSDAAERSSGGLASYADINHKRELYHDERLQRGGSPVLGQYYHRQSSQLQNHEENGLRRSQQQHSMFPRPSTTVGQLTLGGDYIFRGSTGTVLPPPLSGFADSPRSSRLPPGLADAVASVGGRAAGGGTLFTFGGGGDNAGVAAGAGAAAVKSDGHHQRERDHARMTSKECMAAGCKARSKFAYKGSKKPVYCARHRVSGMVDTRHPQCHNKQCTKQPSFGLEGDRRPSYCATHKEAGMINVASRRCQHFQCIRSPNFGFPGDKRATYCKEHCDTGMLDIVSRRCRDPSCNKRPVYNMDGMRPVFCSKHKLPGMVDVVSARCQETGCLRHPSFGYVSNMKARRCARHRLEGMEALNGRRKKCPPAVTAVVTPDMATSSSPTPRPSSSSPQLLPLSSHGTDSTAKATECGTPAGDRGCSSITKSGAIPPTLIRDRPRSVL